MQSPHKLIRTILATLLCALVSGNPLAQEGMVWREVIDANTVYMELDEGTVILELNPLFAPKTVEQFQRLVDEGFYRGLSFYRVIDGFVAQAGYESEEGVASTQATLDSEFELKRDDDLPWTQVETADMFADETGFIDGFAAARDRKNVWLTHCPGVLAMARGRDPDSGSTDFYIVIGQAPRYLDRNLTVFGRVVHGMDVVQRIRRGPVDENGIIESDTGRTRILNMRMAASVELEQRKSIFVMDTNSPGFSDFMRERRNRSDAFFHHKPPRVLDICQVPVGTRIEKLPSQVPEPIGGTPESP